MNCEECAAWLPEYLEGAAAPHERVQIEGHLRECAACRDELADCRRLLAAARSLPRLAPGAAAVLRIAEAIHAAGGSRRRTEFGPVLDVEELADFLRVDADTLQLYLAEIPCFELGGRLLFRRKSVEAWIEKKEADFGMTLGMSEIQRDRVPAAQRTGGVPWTN